MEYFPKHTTENHVLIVLMAESCNGICDLFVMVLEFSVMVLLFFFQQGCLIVFI